MSDIVEQLRASVTQCRAVDRSALLAAAADEIERLRSLQRPQPGKRNDHDAAPAARATHEAAPLPAQQVTRGDGTGETTREHDKDQERRTMNTDNTQDGSEQSPASAGSHGLSEAEIDALEYVVVEGRIACKGDYGILRSLLVRMRPEWATIGDLGLRPEEGDQRNGSLDGRETVQ